MKTLVIEGENGDSMVSDDGRNISGMDDAERIKYWQELGSEAIFKRAFELINDYCRVHEIDPHIDRTIGFHSKILSEKR